MCPWIVRLGSLLAFCAAGSALAQTPPPPRDQDRQALLQFTAGYDILIWPAGSTLTGCFFLGQRAHRQVVVDAAATWSAAGNIRFDFGQAPGYRDCDSAKSADIRVGFQPDLASSSRIGIRALEAAPNRPTLFIGVGGVVSRSSEEIREAALHELGHALALPHEHQHPASPCPAEFKIAAVCERQDAFAAYSERERQDTLAMMAGQLRRRRDSDLTVLPPYDVRSIMHYRFPPALLSGGTDSACHAFDARTTSTADQAKIAARYPADPDEQRHFLLARGAMLAADLHRSGLSTERAERVARLAEAYVERSFPDLAFAVPFDASRPVIVAIAEPAAIVDATAALCQPRRP